MHKSIEFVPRLIHDSYDSPAKLRGVIRFCKATRIREVQLVPYKMFVEPVWLSRKDQVRRCRQLAGIIRTLRRNGIEGTLNVLRTFMPAGGGEWIGFKQPRLDMHGASKPLMPCSMDPAYLDYINFFYQEMAKTGATKIFVDDDFRFECLGLGPTCFCPLHIAEFNRRYAVRETRESLAKICDDAAPTPLKRQWMEFKRNELLELAQAICKAVHTVNPTVRVGLMLTSTEISLYEGRDIRRLVETFAGDLQPLARPGQGWYADDQRWQLLVGLTDTVFQTQLLSKDTEKLAEIDFYPHSRFNKSTDAGLAYQIQANLVCGLKKQSLWAFDWRDRIDAIHPYAGILKRNLKVFDRIARLIPDTAGMRGVKVAYNLHTGLLRRQRGPDMTYYGPKIPVLLWRLGIPYTFTESDTLILTKDSFPLNREAVNDLLARYNVLMDSNALEFACKLGLAKAIGVRTGRFMEPNAQAKERILPNRINGAAGGLLGACGYASQCRYLQALDQRGTIISHLLNAQGRVSSPGGVASTRNGKRLIVLAYPLEPNRFFLDEIKQAQVQGMLAWLAGGHLPACVTGAPDVCPVVLEDERSGVRLVSLINCSTARAADFTLIVAAPKNSAGYAVSYLTDIGRQVELPARHVIRQHNALKITVPAEAGLSPYQVRVLHLAPR